MAKKALIQKQQKTPKFKVRQYTRCRRLRQEKTYRRRALGREEEVRDQRNAGNWKLHEMRPPRTGMLAAAVIPNRR